MTYTAGVENGNGFETRYPLGGLEGTMTVKIPNSLYTAEIHLGGRTGIDNYLKHFPDLIATATALKAAVFEMDLEEARSMMIHHLQADQSTPELEIPTTMFYRYDGESDYVGYATGRIYPVDTPQGRRNLLAITRTITAPHQAFGLGRFSVEQLIVLNPKATDLGFRSRNPAAVRAVMLADAIIDGELYPYQKKYTDDPTFTYHKLMMELWYRIHKYGAYPVVETGVSKGDYIDENRAYKPKPDKTTRGLSTLQIAAMMKEFGMRKRDSVYTVGPLKK